jgi:hypothetical protein
MKMSNQLSLNYSVPVAPTFRCSGCGSLFLVPHCSVCGRPGKMSVPPLPRKIVLRSGRPDQWRLDPPAARPPQPPPVASPLAPACGLCGRPLGGFGRCRCTLFRQLIED